MNEPQQDFDITIGLIVYNEFENLNGILDCLVSQNVDGLSLELIIVDNNSQDRSLELIQNFIASTPTSITIRLIQRSTNHLGEARQDVVINSKASLIAFTDCDCRPKASWLRGLHDQFLEISQRNPQLGGLGSLARFTRPGFLNLPFRVLSQTFFGHFNSTQMKSTEKMLNVSHIPTANIIYSKDALLKVGGFSSDFPRVCEDVDLNLRLKKNSFELIFSPDHEVNHIGPKSLKNWFNKIFVYGLGQAKIYRFHPDFRQFRYCLPMVYLPTMVLLFLGSFFSLFAFILLSCYLLVLLAVSLVGHLSLGSLSLLSILYTWLFFMVTHTAYSAGFLRGLIFGTRTIEIN